MTPILAGIGVYVLVQLVIGLLVSRGIRTEDDYLVAGRRLGPGLVCFSIFATWFGAETCVGAAGQVYAHGLTRTSVAPFAYGLCLVLMGLVFAAPFWRARITTLADLFRSRYSARVERLAAILLIPTSLLWAAAQIRAFGQVLSAAGGLRFETAIAVSASIAILYTVAGGLMADVVTDLVQALALVLGLVVVAAAVVTELGGVSAAMATIDPQRVTILRGGGPGLLATAEAWAIPVCGSVVAQEVVSRALAARSPEVARSSALLGGGLYLLVGLLPVLLGLVGLRLLPELEDPEQLLPVLARRYLSGLAYVVFAGALISAILSTVDSTLLVAASLLSRNLVLARRPDASQRLRLRAARIGVVGFGLLAWLLAHRSESVFELVEEASGFGSAGILVVVVFGLFTRFGGPRAAMASLGAGIAIWVWGSYVADHPYPYLASLGAALLGFLVVAALWDRRGPRIASLPGRSAG